MRVVPCHGRGECLLAVFQGVSEATPQDAYARQPGEQRDSFATGVLGGQHGQRPLGAGERLRALI